jgi:hypothetical protein
MKHTPPVTNPTRAEQCIRMFGNPTHRALNSYSSQIIRSERHEREQHTQSGGGGKQVSLAYLTHDMRVRINEDSSTSKLFVYFEAL